MDWDDYRYFAALARAGSVRGAADDLGVNPSTVTRRLEHLESELGVALFLRTGRGMNITTEGVEVAQRVDEIGNHFRLLETSIKGRENQLAGSISITIPDIIANNFLIGDLAPFLEMYPEIELTLLPRFRDPARQSEVDVRINLTDDPPEWMIGRRLGRFGLAAYGAPEYLQERGTGATATWVGWPPGNEIAGHYNQLRARYFPEIAATLNIDQVEMQRSALLARLGIGILPTFIGDADSRLVQIDTMPVQESPSVWILTHPNARSTRRIQIFLEYLREIFSDRQEQIFV